MTKPNELMSAIEIAHSFMDISPVMDDSVRVPGTDVIKMITAAQRNVLECAAKKALHSPSNLVASERIHALMPRPLEQGDKVVIPGCTPVGEVLQVNEKGILVQWPPSSGEYVRPSWHSRDQLAFIPSQPKVRTCELCPKELLPDDEHDLCADCWPAP